MVAVAAASFLGAAGAILAAIGLGAGGREVTHLALLLMGSALVLSVLMAIASPRLRALSVRQRLLAIASLITGSVFLELIVLSQQMFVSDHDARLLGVLLVHATATAVGASVALSGAMTRAIDRLTSTARELGAGHLEARAGAQGAGPELDLLAATMDSMADGLQSSIERERNAERVRRDLVTAVSHDLRTPLARLRAMAEAIHDGVVDDPAALRAYIAEMRRSVESLGQLVEDLFELVQLDAGAIATETQRARLEAIVSVALDACRGDAVEKGLRVETSLGDAAHRLCSPRLTRVLQNLLQNAIRHTPADGTVRVEARIDRGRLEIAVSDTGEGIPPSQLERVFEPFWRADAARSGSGAGLGLALAKRITEALGGTISVERVPASGTRFAVDLPA